MDTVTPPAPLVDTALSVREAARILTFEAILAAPDELTKDLPLWGGVLRLRSASWGNYQRALDAARVVGANGKTALPTQPLNRWKLFYTLVEPQLTIEQIEQIWEQKSSTAIFTLIRWVDYLNGDGPDPEPPPPPAAVPAEPAADGDPAPPLVTDEEAQAALFSGGAGLADEPVLPVQTDVADGLPDGGGVLGAPV